VKPLGDGKLEKAKHTILDERSKAVKTGFTKIIE
jgi:hypothetical protein